MGEPKGPGLARAKAPFFVQKTQFVGQDARLREAFATADVISEGAVYDRAWFGSTSIVLAVPLRERARALRLAGECVHMRLRAVRLARREAELRSQAPLGISRCDVKIVPAEGGLRIDVDIEAPLLRSQAARPA